MYGKETGASKLAIVFWLIVLFLTVHVGIKLGHVYLDYYRMEDEMASKASVAQALKDEEVIADLVKKAKELDLPLEAENFVLKRTEETHRMKISTQWDEEVHFLFDVYVKTFHFAPAVDENYQRSR